MAIEHQILRTSRLHNLLTREHLFLSPLRHGLDPAHPEGEGERIEVFAREVVALDRDAEDLPWLVFLQGGPGFGAPRPHGKGGWIGRALEGHRVLLMDERGTGRSTALNAQSLARWGGPAEVARVLACFRADSIVADCESIRRTLLGPEGRWKILGQSFGGFCATHYLSRAPEALEAVLLTGGLPPLDATADQIYARTFPLVLERNRRYYERFGDDADRIRSVAEFVDTREVRLPTGGRLTRRLLQLLGLHLGVSDGPQEIHYLFETPWVHGRVGRELSYAFLRGFENLLSFDTNPLYAILHEACYTQGTASNWAAERQRARHPEFDREEGPLYFTGEMVFPWMFEELPALVPLKEAAHLLAEREDWPVLYDREALGQNRVPVAAAVYFDDMFVEREFSLETAGAIRGAKLWVTNEFEHNGLRVEGERILGHLLEML